jgi:hypothetical protein
MIGKAQYTSKRFTNGITYAVACQRTTARSTACRTDIAR